MTKMYTVVQKTIVRAPNMVEAKKIAEGLEANGSLIHSDSTIEQGAEGLIDSFIVDEEKFDDDLGPVSTIDFLRSENKRLAKLADKYKNVNYEASSAVYRAAYDAFSSFNLPKVKKPSFNKNVKAAETAVAVFADWQLGKVTPDYNSEVLANRIDLYTEKLLEITDIQRADHPVKNLHVWLLGDIVEGEEIFPGQSHLIDSGLYRQVGVNGPEILTNFLTTALENFEHVHVTGVIGNHGCHTVDTLALTEDGFKSIDQISLRDKVLSVDDDGNYQWVNIEGIVDYSYTGKLYSYDSSNLAFSVTEDHRIVGYHPDRDEWIVSNPADVMWRTRLFSSAQNNNIDNVSYTDSMIKLAAWCLTDSHRDKNGYWHFYQSGDKVNQIKNLLEANSISFTFTQRDRNIESIEGKLLLSTKPQHELHVTGGLDGNAYLSNLVSDKNVLPDWIYSLSQRQFDVFLQELIYCDGTYPNGSSMTLYCSRKTLRDQLQIALTMNGYSAKEKEYRPNHWKLNITKNNFAGLKKESIEVDEVSSERVWCLRVPYGRFFVKKNGIVHLSGNSVGGRNRRQYDPETNMDRLLYKIVQLIFSKEDRITFDIPDGRGERNWYAIDSIGNYKTLLLHGDQLPHPSSVHGYYKRVLGWKDGAIPEHFEDVFMGHYHQQFKITIGSTILRVSGSPESFNTYAQEYFNSMSRPCQHLMFVHPENGVTSEYSIWLD